MADADPPYKIDDGEAPSDRDGHAPDSDPLEEQVAHGVQQHHREQKRDAETYEPSVRRGTGQHDGADFFRDRAEGVAGLDYRGSFGFHRCFVLLVHAALATLRG